jgi:hypothetical protein
MAPGVFCAGEIGPAGAAALEEVATAGGFDDMTTTVTPPRWQADARAGFKRSLTRRGELREAGDDGKAKDRGR